MSNRMHISKRASPINCPRSMQKHKDLHEILQERNSRFLQKRKIEASTSYFKAQSHFAMNWF